MLTRFKPETSVLLLIDYQIGTLQLARTTPADEALRNAVILAKVAKVYGMPIIMTASQEGRVQGPTADVFQRVAPEAYEAKIMREGIIDAWQEPAFCLAVDATERRQLVVAAITTDICLVFPVESAAQAGYEVQAVMDASSSPFAMNEEISRRRLERAGVLMTVTNTITAELVADWSTPQGLEVVAMLPTPALMRPID
jgi:nicotinamidase-related amidase